MTTVVAAFVGALVGSVGAVIVEEALRRWRERRQRSEAVVRRYLFELQDAVEALWHRLFNIAYEGGKGAMTEEYRQTTTVYALGRVLAAERVLALEGVYPELSKLYPELGEALQDPRLSVALRVPGFQQYDRIALAEAVLERDQDGFRTSTYLAFTGRYGEAEVAAPWLAEARNAVATLGDRSAIDPLLRTLGRVATETASATGLRTSIAEKLAKFEASGTQRRGRRSAASRPTS